MPYGVAWFGYLWQGIKWGYAPHDTASNRKMMEIYGKPHRLDFEVAYLP